MIVVEMRLAIIRMEIGRVGELAMGKELPVRG